jgi:predicted nucleic acid-binding protein
MKTATLSIRLDEDLDKLLGKASKQVGRSRSEVARDALRRQLRLTQFEAIRRRMMPFAEARGYLTDEDVIASATATRGLCADVLRTVIEFHDLVVSDHLVGEVRRVLKDKFGASPDLIADVVWLLRQDTIASESQPLRDVPLSDPADVAIVSSALNGAADVLITGDKEILDLRRVGSLEILTPRQFWDRERGQQGGGHVR